MDTRVRKKRRLLLALAVVLVSMGLCTAFVLISFARIVSPCSFIPASVHNPPIPTGAEQVVVSTPVVVVIQGQWKREAREIYFVTTTKPESVYSFYKDALSRDGWSNESAYEGSNELLGGVQLSPCCASATFNWGCGFESRSIFAVDRLYAATLDSGKTSVTLNYQYVP